LANMASAISALYSLGYTLAEDDNPLGEYMEEDRASDKSSPDILRHRHRQMYGFENVHQNGNQNGNQHFDMAHATHAMPPVSSYAAMIAGIGLNLSAVSVPLCLSVCLFPPDRTQVCHSFVSLPVLLCLRKNCCRG
jgi:hypothetical protein